MLRHFQADPTDFPLDDYEVDELENIVEQYLAAAKASDDTNQEDLHKQLALIAFIAGRSYQSEKVAGDLDDELDQGQFKDPGLIHLQLTPQKAATLIEWLLED